MTSHLCETTYQIYEEKLVHLERRRYGKYVFIMRRRMFEWFGQVKKRNEREDTTVLWR